MFKSLIICILAAITFSSSAYGQDTDKAPGTSMQTPKIIAPPASLAPGEIQAQTQSGGFTFDIQATPLVVQANKQVIVNVLVKQKDQLYRKLQPITGYYAHLSGLFENREELFHAHPIGDEPHSPHQGSGPSLKFHITFPKPGWYRLILQIKAEDHDIFAPIDVLVN